ncbi:MAG: hypothetical protein AAGF92_09530 [Myxococcota bacterium]
MSDRYAIPQILDGLSRTLHRDDAGPAQALDAPALEEMPEIQIGLAEGHRLQLLRTRISSTNADPFGRLPSETDAARSVRRLH